MPYRTLYQLIALNFGIMYDASWLSYGEIWRKSGRSHRGDFRTEMGDLSLFGGHCDVGKRGERVSRSTCYGTGCRCYAQQVDKGIRWDASVLLLGTFSQVYESRTTCGRQRLVGAGRFIEAPATAPSAYRRRKADAACSSDLLQRLQLQRDHFEQERAALYASGDQSIVFSFEIVMSIPLMHPSPNVLPSMAFSAMIRAPSTNVSHRLDAFSGDDHSTLHSHRHHRIVSCLTSSVLDDDGAYTHAHTDRFSDTSRSSAIYWKSVAHFPAPVQNPWTSAPSRDFRYACHPQI